MYRIPKRFSRPPRYDHFATPPKLGKRYSNSFNNKTQDLLSAVLVAVYEIYMIVVICEEIMGTISVKSIIELVC